MSGTSATGRARLGRALTTPTAIAAAAVGVVYALTLYPGVGGVVNHGDSSKFQFLGWIAGVSHPPGNPLYLLLDVLVSHVPLGGSVAVRVTALSAVLGVLALGVLGATATRLAGGATGGVLTVLAVGLGPLYWTLSTEAEVYTLNALLVAVTAHFSVRYLLGDGRRMLAAAAFVYVLSFANHLTVATMAPAMALLLIRQGRAEGGRAVATTLLSGLGGAVMAALAYGVLLWRASDGPAYTELHDELSVRSAFAYVTAREFRHSFDLPRLWELGSERLPEVLARLQKQWVWPLLATAPLGLAALVDRHRRVATFLALAIVGQLVFPLVYQIDDPEGFYVPIVVLVGLLVGVSPLVWPRRGGRALHAVAVVALLVPLFGGQWKGARERAPTDLVEDVDELRETAWDLHDVVARVPEGARLLAPCGHYGCAQVLNYFRFADPEFARKGLEIAHLPGRPAGWHAPWSEIDLSVPPDRPICGIVPMEARALRSRGWRVRTIERPPVEHAGAVRERPPVFCTE